ncbi:DNA-binding Lrp family transcriptional regulator [Nakamurella sp. UYEF19]|uniref:Lrp/AsnC family transcriptional regulator n=1 Tax=Nakamurella sp. UYEF19 TaxID=1756392 RepID=UPI003398616F
MTSCLWSAALEEETPTRLRPPAVSGAALSATVRVRLATSGHCAGFEEWLSGQLDVVEVFQCTGHFDYELRVASRDPQRLNTAIAAIRHAGGAVETETTLLSTRLDS